MRNKLGVCCALIVSILITMTGCSMGYEDYSGAATVMGTIVQCSFRAYGAGNGENVWLSTQGTGNELEYQMLSRRVDDSEIARLNASAGNEEGFELSQELEAYLELCLELSEQTMGAFDITLGALTQLWNIDEAAVDSDNYHIPSPEEIENALDVCGYEKLVINNHRAYMPAGMVIDMGAVGKGIFLSRIYDDWQQTVRYGVVAAGGSILTYGYKDGGQRWNVGIADPSGEQSVIATLKLEGTYYVSTSGDYERYVEVDGVRYHHILDASTGYPSESGISSVTAVIKVDANNTSGNTNGNYIMSNSMVNGLLSDALTTAIFVLGEKEGLRLAHQYDAEILIVRNDGTVVMTDGMHQYVD